MLASLPNKIAHLVKKHLRSLKIIALVFSIAIYIFCLNLLQTKNRELAETRTSIELLKSFRSPNSEELVKPCDTIKEIVTTIDQQEISYSSMSSTETDILITLQNQNFEKTLTLMQVILEKHPCVDIEQLNIYANTDTPTGEISGNIKFKNNPD